MTDRIRLAAQAFLDCHDAFVMKQSREVAYAMKDAADALRRALAEPAEGDTFAAGVEAAAKWHDDLGADDTPHGARGHAWYASQIRALAPSVPSGPREGDKT